MARRLTGILVLIFVQLTCDAQEIPDRNPVFARVTVGQKIYFAPEHTLSPKDITMDFKPSHSINVGGGVDFVLNQPKPDAGLWQLHASFNVGSAAIKYTGLLEREVHGFDRDVSWEKKTWTSSIEGVFGVSRTHSLSNDWRLVFGFGLSLQDIIIRDHHLAHTALVTSRGETRHTDIFTQENNGFFPGERRDQNLRLNPVYTLGFSRNLQKQRRLNFEFRLCKSNQPIVAPLNFSLGETGELRYRKSFIGLDISYIFGLNRALSFNI
ncbi:MAG: hypothetical protein JJ975_08115 [Bacteroidia bacterium]|nr:hypothetical protein [Bacteroidia bacterium]